MLTFKISLNSEHLCHAGIPGYGVLTTVITSVSRPGEEYDQMKGLPISRSEYEHESELSVGGLASSEPPPDGAHMDWLKRDLKEGDVIVIEVCAAGPADPPVEVRPRDRKFDAKAKRRYVRRLCKELGWKAVKAGK